MNTAVILSVSVMVTVMVQCLFQVGVAIGP